MSIKIKETTSAEEVNILIRNGYNLQTAVQKDGIIRYFLIKQIENKMPRQCANTTEAVNQ